MGEVPEHWRVEKFRWVTKLSNQKNVDDVERPMLSLSAYDGIKFKEYEYETQKRTEEQNMVYMVVKPNQLVVNPMWVMKRSIAVSELNGIVSPAYRVYDISDDYLPKYFHYLMRSDIYVDEYNRHIRGLTTYDRSVRKDDFAELLVPIPPIEEQAAIVAFLEEQTAVINQFLANKRQLITLLEEQKQVVINTAVTQGLDPNAPRKPSGIDWLGDIPAHWEGIKLKNLSKFIQTGPFGSQLHAHDYVDNQTPLINPIHLQNGRIIPDWSITVDDETLKRLERHQLEVGDVILARRGELGRCAVVDSESAGWLCGTGSMNLRPKSDRIFSPYLAQIIQSEKVKNWLTTESVGSTMDNLNGSILGNLKVPVPPVQEQKQIIHSCREREAVINSAIKRIQREIELIEEYRTTLIAHAVTGKIDVRTIQ